MYDKLDALVADDSLLSERQERMPHAQFFNPTDGEGKYKPWGIGMERARAEQANFLPGTEWQFIEEYAFKKERKDVFLTQTPTIVWVVRGRKELEDRETKEPAGPIKGGPRSEEYRQHPERFKLFSSNIIFFASPTGELLHDQPIKLTTRGAAGAALVDAYEQYEQKNGFYSLANCFRKDVYDLFMAHRGDGEGKKKVDPLFWCFWLFQPILTPKEVGEADDTSWVASAQSYTRPRSLADLNRIAIDPSSESGKIIRQAFEDYRHWMHGPATKTPPAAQTAQTVELREKVVFRTSFEGFVSSKPSRQISREATPRPYWTVKLIESIREQEHIACVFDPNLFDTIKEMSAGNRVAVTGEFTESNSSNPYRVLILDSVTIAEEAIAAPSQPAATADQG